MNYIFNVELAAKIGLDESILLENLVFWIKKNKANKKHEHGGKNWTYNSTSAFHELFPFWSLSQIKRILKSLLNQDVIVINCFNENRYDRTNWYSLSNSYYYLIDETKSANGEDQNSQCTLDEISQSLIKQI